MEGEPTKLYRLYIECAEIHSRSGNVGEMKDCLFEALEHGEKSEEFDNISKTGFAVRAELLTKKAETIARRYDIKDPIKAVEYRLKEAGRFYISAGLKVPEHKFEEILKTVFNCVLDFWSSELEAAMDVRDYEHSSVCEEKIIGLKLQYRDRVDEYRGPVSETPRETAYARAT